jgi:hypothetical protein
MGMVMPSHRPEFQPPGAILPHAAVPVVGAVPNNFNGNPSSYTHQEIMNMTLFYNEDFFILPGDDIATLPKTSSGSGCPRCNDVPSKICTIMWESDITFYRVGS